MHAVLHTLAYGRLPTLLSAHPDSHSGPTGTHRTLRGQRETAVHSICRPMGHCCASSSNHKFLPLEVSGLLERVVTPAADIFIKENSLQGNLSQRDL